MKRHRDVLTAMKRQRDIIKRHRDVIKRQRDVMKRHRNIMKRHKRHYEEMTTLYKTYKHQTEYLKTVLHCSYATTFNKGFNESHSKPVQSKDIYMCHM